MTMFEGLKTIAEIKAQYRKLAFQHHPDLGGDLEAMKAINNAYEKALKALDGQESVGTDGKAHVYRWDEETERKIMETIDALIRLKMDDVEITIIGNWIWITGATKPYKESLKEIKCSWHSQRGCWYWKPYEGRYWGSGKSSLEELARTYGKTEVEDLKRKDRKGKGKGRGKLTA